MLLTNPRVALTAALLVGSVLFLPLPASAQQQMYPQMGPGMMDQGMMGPGMMSPGMMSPGMMSPGMMGQGMMGRGMMGPGMMGQGMMGPGMMGGQGCPGMQGAGMMDQGMMGQGMMSGGMMGMMHKGMMHHDDLDGGMMGPGMMGYGMMSGGGQGFVMQPAPAQLSAADVTYNLERLLAARGNPHLKVGKVADKDADTIVGEVVTTDGSLVERYEVDKRSGLAKLVP